MKRLLLLVMGDGSGANTFINVVDEDGKVVGRLAGVQRCAVVSASGRGHPSVELTVATPRTQVALSRAPS